MILILAGVLLFLSFIVHMLWWRNSRPVRTTSALLIVFLSVPVVTIGVSFFLSTSIHLLQALEVFRLVLFYISYTLVYIVLYSAIEQESPTLAIIHYIKRQGGGGCDESTLVQHLRASEVIEKRFALMAQGGWIMPTGVKWHLTKKGACIACIFENAATFFGLKTGG